MTRRDDNGRVFRVCLRCGRPVAKTVNGYGRSCWNIVKPKPIKPYINEVPFVDTGTTDYLARVYGEFTTWRNEF